MNLNVVSYSIPHFSVHLHTFTRKLITKQVLKIKNISQIFYKIKKKHHSKHWCIYHYYSGGKMMVYYITSQSRPGYKYSWDGSQLAGCPEDRKSRTVLTSPIALWLARTYKIDQKINFHNTIIKQNTLYTQNTIDEIWLVFSLGCSRPPKQKSNCL